MDPRPFHAPIGRVRRVSDMPPWEPPLAGTEIEHLLASLDRLRATFAWKTADLDPAGLSFRFPSSVLSLGGLLKHLARAEDEIFTRRLVGSPISEPWRSAPWAEDPDWDFTSAVHDSPEDLYGRWVATVERSRAAVQRALVFVARNQNVQGNDAAWAQHGTFDGGFVYTCANGGESFASDAAGEGRYGEKMPPEGRALQQRFYEAQLQLAAREGLPVRSFSNARDMLSALDDDIPQVLVSDIRMPGGSGLELLAKVIRRARAAVKIPEAYLDVQKIAREVISEIGYTKSEYMFEANSCGILSAIHEQSADINQGVDKKKKEEQQKN